MLGGVAGFRTRVCVAWSSLHVQAPVGLSCLHIRLVSLCWAAVVRGAAAAVPGGVWLDSDGGRSFVSELGPPPLAVSTAVGAPLLPRRINIEFRGAGFNKRRHVAPFLDHKP